jgi:hypothetical protein
MLLPRRAPLLLQESAPFSPHPVAPYPSLGERALRILLLDYCNTLTHMYHYCVADAGVAAGLRGTDGDGQGGMGHW